MDLAAVPLPPLTRLEGHDAVDLKKPFLPRGHRLQMRLGQGIFLELVIKLNGAFKSAQPPGGLFTVQSGRWSSVPSAAKHN